MLSYFVNIDFLKKLSLECFCTLICNLSRRCNLTVDVTFTALQPHCRSRKVSFLLFVFLYFLLLLLLPFEVLRSFSISQNLNRFLSPHLSSQSQSHRMQCKWTEASIRFNLPGMSVLYEATDFAYWFLDHEVVRIECYRLINLCRWLV